MARYLNQTMTSARRLAVFVVLLTLASVAVSTAWACMEDAGLVLVDGELPGGG